MVAIVDIVPVDPDKRIKCVFRVIGFPQDSLFDRFHAPDMPGITVSVVIRKDSNLIVGVAVKLVLELFGIRRNRIGVVDFCYTFFHVLFNLVAYIIHKLTTRNDDVRLSLNIAAIRVPKKHPCVVDNLSDNFPLHGLPVFDGRVEIKVHCSIAVNGSVSKEFSVFGNDSVTLNDSRKLVVYDFHNTLQLCGSVCSCGRKRGSLHCKVVRCDRCHLKKNNLFQEVECWGRKPVCLNALPLVSDEEVLVDLYGIVKTNLLIEVMGFFVPLLDFIVCRGFHFLCHYSTSPPSRSRCCSFFSAETGSKPRMFVIPRLKSLTAFAAAFACS